MKNLFDKEALNEILVRIDKLTPETQNKWGKMNVAQMLSHCAKVFDMASGQLKPKRGFIGYVLGPVFKSSYTNDKPFQKSSPTSKEFIIVGDKEFETEKQNLIKAAKDFFNGGADNVTTHPHPFFGKFKPEEWSTGMYKHLDHHLQQFGV